MSLCNIRRAISDPSSGPTDILSAQLYRILQLPGFITTKLKHITCGKLLNSFFEILNAFY